MDIKVICKILNDGGLVITPTDTVYGIMGDATNENVIKKVFVAKGREYNKPLILLMDSIEMLERYTDGISDVERNIMNKFWPGLVTMILNKNDNVNELITSGMDTVGIRIPDNSDLLKIIKVLGRPIISTSANCSGEEVIANVDMIDDKLRSKVDYIVDGGELSNEVSAVIRIVDDKLVVLRNGMLVKELEKFVEEI